MIHFSLDKTDYNKNDLETLKERALQIRKTLCMNEGDFTGWTVQPSVIDEQTINKMESVAKRIQSLCDVLIVIGIGGSYLGTAAVYDALGGNKKGCPEIVYAGNNVSGNYHAKFKQIVAEKEVCLCVISKSGGTMETSLAFSFLKELLYDKYGKDNTSERIVSITDAEKGQLRKETIDNNYDSFEIPDNIGGRYSAFTPGTLFPLVVAGVDIRALIKGAKDISNNEEFWNNEGVYYPIVRYSLMNAGKDIEVFECYDPSMRLVGEWCKQLFGESEGKEGKGLFPATMIFSTDLHSLGQFLQDGNQIFFETIINVLNWENDIVIPESLSDKKIAGRSLNDINQLVLHAVIEAHSKGNIPITLIEIDDATEYSLGQLLYFLMMTAGITGTLMNVDPFTQDGVEQYKKEVKKMLEN